MNLCILDSAEEFQRIPSKDYRAHHVLFVLKKHRGDQFRAGAPNGQIGHATILSADAESIHIQFTAESLAPPLRPLKIYLGTVRPIQAARIVKELAILGVESILFFPTELGEKSYAQSNFYQNKEYFEYARAGCEQSGNPRLPTISYVWSLQKALEQTSDLPATRIVCHPQKDASRLSAIECTTLPMIIAIGTERGWTEKEMKLFSDFGFDAATLGDRILKTETAAIVAVSVVLSRLSYL